MLAPRRVGLAVVAMLMLAGCAVGPDYRAAGPSQLGVPQHYVATDDTASPELGRWWDQFRDPVLADLVARATTGNLDLAQSAERLIQAREALIQARGARLPAVTLSSSNGRNFDSLLGDTTALSAQLGASWTVDLFGALSRAQQSAAASLQAAGYDRAALHVSIASQVAQTYIAYRADVARLAIARDTLKVQDDNLDIARWRAAAGLVSSLDVAQALTQREQTAATIEPLVTAIAQTRNQLAILTGQAPGAVDGLLAAAAPIPAGPVSLAAGIPADILRRRPDVRSSERALAAATAQIGVAKAQLYPQLVLTGNIGVTALSLGSLGNEITGSLFAALTQTLFDGGQLRSKVRVQESATRAAFSAYKATVLSALQDIENDEVALGSAAGRAHDFAAAVDAAETAAILARNQYRSGLTTLQTLLTAEQSLLAARDGLASAQSDQATALVQLYAALGGGWDPAVPALAVNTGPVSEH